MSENAFVGRTSAPGDDDLTAVLGPRARARWDKLVEAFGARHDVDDRAWASYSPKAGWSLKLLRRKRAIVYLVPRARTFAVAFALGDAARKAALAARLPESVREALTTARKYAEGYAVRFEVRSRADVDAVLALARAKIEA